MDAATYPDEEVARFINDNVVPLKLAFDAQPYAEDFGIKWTPSLLILDNKGEEHHRTVGFLEPRELIPSIMMGMAKTHFAHDRFNEALEVLDRLLREYPHSEFAAEAVYLSGVCGYKSTHDPKKLREAYDRLKAKYPDSVWAKRADPYRKIA